MTLTLITVNYQNAQATLELLRSLECQTERVFDVIVVDNDSAPDDRALLGSYAVSSPLRLDIIYSDRNRGFSGGNNLAIRKALAQGSEWLLLINNDTTVETDFIATLGAQLPTQPCVVGLPLNEGERTAYGGTVRWLRPTLPHLYESPTFHVSRSTFLYAIGAGMLVHRDVFERIGLLDEHYFLYFEDADFSLRARQADIPLIFFREPVIRHRGSESTRTLGHPLLVRYHARNALRFNWHNGPWWVKAAVPLAVAYGSVLQLGKLLFRHHVPESRATLAGILDVVRDRWGRIDTRIHIGIECEQSEGRAWGIGRVVLLLLQELAADSTLARTHCFHLYFKSRIPDCPWLKKPVFQTTIIGQPFPRYRSFVLYSYVFLPLRLWFARLDAMFYPNYMLPIIHPPFTPSLVLLTDDIYYERRSSDQRLHHRLAYWVFSSWAVWRATKVLAISGSSKRELVRLFGIALERIAVAPLAAERAGTAGENRHGSYILFVAQAFPRRHLRETVRAFEQISVQFPDLKFIVVGPDKYRPPLDIRNERIIRRDRVSDTELATLYAHARAFVYVSDREAFGLPPLEALSYGVPSVLADKPVSRELFGDHAFFVSDPDSPDSIAAAITAALTDDARRAVIRSAAPAILSRYTRMQFRLGWLEIVRGMISPEQ